MEKASDIIDSIGAARMAVCLGVSASRVRMARAEGKLPACWFDTCEKLTGQTLPREFFAFKGGVNE